MHVNVLIIGTVPTHQCTDPPMQKAPVGEHLTFTQVILAVMVGVTTAMIVTNIVVLSTSVRVLPKTVSPGQEIG